MIYRVVMADNSKKASDVDTMSVDAKTGLQRSLESFK